MKNRTITYLLILFGLFVIIKCSTPNPEIKKEQTINNVRFDTISKYIISARALNCNGLPDSVFEMINLKCLVVVGEDCDVGNNIECCRIREISPKIGKLKNLEELYLNLSAFDKFPNEIGECQKLKRIDLTDGGIENIDILTKLTNLESLSLFGCYISKLPKDIAKLTKLKELGLAGTNINMQELNRIKKALPNCDVTFSKY